MSRNCTRQIFCSRWNAGCPRIRETLLLSVRTTTSRSVEAANAGKLPEAISDGNDSASQRVRCSRPQRHVKNRTFCLRLKRSVMPPGHLQRYRRRLHGQTAREPSFPMTRVSGQRTTKCPPFSKYCRLLSMIFCACTHARMTA